MFMRLFEEIIGELRSFQEAFQRDSTFREYRADSGSVWPQSGRGSIVMKSDTAVELGSPKDESVSFLMWTEDASLVKDGVISLIGPELAESAQRHLPFGKVVILGVNGFNEENCYERHREIELVRFDVNLEGYMMRAASQYMREWSRISTEALAKGFSLKIMGSVLIEMYRSLDYVHVAEILFITSSSEDVRKLKDLGDRSNKIIGAMNKMAVDMSLDCSTCEYNEVCAEGAGLRSLRDSLAKEK
jgi:CO dehydrogenase/acetyl-CoA synthase beta subunit